MTNYIQNLRSKKFLIVTLLLLAFQFIYAQSDSYQQGVIYTRIAPGSKAQLDDLFNDDGALNNYSITKIEQPFKLGDATISRIFRIHFNPSFSADELIKTLMQFPFIEYAEKIPIYKISFVANDPFQIHQYNLTKVNAQQAWDITKGSTSVVIAIVDNAIRITHQDLEPNIWINPNVNQATGNDFADGYYNDLNGWNVADSNNNPNPPTGISSGSDWNHGTHVAGIASAATNNGLGIAALGFNCRIMAVKCAPDTAKNGNTLPNPYDGVYYAVLNKANVINMSFEASAPNATDQSIIEYAYNAGVVCIAAAGNDTSATAVYPATYPHVIGVGATDQNDVIANFSNFGVNATVMAPGWDIYSTFGWANNAYGYLYGTSMASPLVCGLAGLIIAENPKLNPDQVKYFIQAGCDDIDAINPGRAGQMGSGRINAYKSLQLVQQDLNNYNSNEIINVFPNPSNDIFNIRFNERCINSSFQIILHNLLGQEVYNQTINGFSGFYYPLNLLGMAQGVYIAQIILPNQSLYKVLVKGQN